MYTIGKHRSRHRFKGNWTKIQRAKHFTRNKKFWQKRSDGYRIKLGKHEDVQEKEKNIGIKHRTLY